MAPWASSSSSAAHGGQMGAAPSVNFVQRLGKGAYGEVWSAEYRGGPVAAKITNCPTGFRKHEVALLRAAQGPHTVRLLGELENTSKGHAILMELCHGNLTERISAAKLENRPQDPAKFLTILAELCQGLIGLHTKHIIFGDLKPDNLLINSRGRLVFADFGDARGPQTSRQANSREVGWGCPKYHAVPDYDARRMSFASDMWMLAQTAIHYWTRQPASSNPSPIPDDIPLRDHLAQCFAKNPADRPTAVQILQWIKHERKWGVYADRAGSPARARSPGRAASPLPGRAGSPTRRGSTRQNGSPWRERPRSPRRERAGSPSRVRPRSDDPMRELQQRMKMSSKIKASGKRNESRSAFATISNK